MDQVCEHEQKKLPKRCRVAWQGLEPIELREAFSFQGFCPDTQGIASSHLVFLSGLSVTLEPLIRSLFTLQKGFKNVSKPYRKGYQTTKGRQGTIISKPRTERSLLFQGFCRDTSDIASSHIVFQSWLLIRDDEREPTYYFSKTVRHYAL